AQAEMAAGPFDKLKKKVKKAKKTADEAAAVVDVAERARRTKGRSVVKAITGSSSGGGSGCFSGHSGSSSASACTAPPPGHAGRAGKTPAKYAGATKCAALGIGNAFVGRDGTYTFSQGISTQERSGLLDRVNVSPSNGCVFEGLGVGDVLYVEFDASKYKKYDYAIQCVSFDGGEQLDNTNGPSVGNYKGRAIMLHTGNSTGYTPTASGSNSDRSSAYKKYMAKRGRTFTTFNFPALHTDKAGTDFYCQWFNKDTGQSAVALTFRRGPRGG
ncbi:MAG: hypothetical protein SXU28_14270, partial [Pseudomonadota bacterium]|nr:hypothetical protein [Pseudomonadota bacterium]